MISINDHEPRTFECLLIYIYKGEVLRIKRVVRPRATNLVIGLHNKNAEPFGLVFGVGNKGGMR